MDVEEIILNLIQTKEVKTQLKNLQVLTSLLSDILYHLDEYDSGSESESGSEDESEDEDESEYCSFNSQMSDKSTGLFKSTGKAVMFLAPKKFAKKMIDRRKTRLMTRRQRAKTIAKQEKNKRLFKTTGKLMMMFAPAKQAPKSLFKTTGKMIMAFSSGPKTIVQKTKTLSRKMTRASFGQSFRKAISRRMTKTTRRFTRKNVVVPKAQPNISGHVQQKKGLFKATGRMLLAFGGGKPARSVSRISTHGKRLTRKYTKTVLNEGKKLVRGLSSKAINFRQKSSKFSTRIYGNSITVLSHF